MSFGLPFVLVHETGAEEAGELGKPGEKKYVVTGPDILMWNDVLHA
jgi:hypothetical protein